jgi:alkyl hydroperoxide reductase subunit AhpC
MPHLAETLETYKDKNFDILGISIDTDTAAWRKGVRDLEVSWNSLCIPTGQDGWENELTDSYGVEGVPTGVLVSPDGEILSIDHPMNLIQNLDEYIK